MTLVTLQFTAHSEIDSQQAADADAHGGGEANAGVERENGLVQHVKAVGEIAGRQAARIEPDGIAAQRKCRNSRSDVLMDIDVAIVTSANQLGKVEIESRSESQCRR